MESYLEVSWLSNFLILLNASTLAFYLGGKPCTFRYLVLYSAVIPLAAGLLFRPDLSLCMEKLAVNDGASHVVQCQCASVVWRQLSFGSLLCAGGSDTDRLVGDLHLHMAGNVLSLEV